jgi:lycopene cyclase domain-containing protein
LNWLYLALNLGSLAIPLAFSFEPKVAFHKKWKYLWPSLVIMAVIFLVWDAWFTAEGIWEFNHDYVLGFDIGNMPFEEYMFFICIPYACVFTHEALKHYIPATWFDNKGQLITLPLSLICIFTALTHFDNLYTLVTFLSLGVLLFVIHFKLKPPFIGRFFFTYLVTVIPFILVNGFLTAMPVLIYNDNENLGIRVGTIPLDDFFYWMLLFLGNITIYEYLKNRNSA